MLMPHALLLLLAAAAPAAASSPPATGPATILSDPDGPEGLAFRGAKLIR